MVIGDNVIFLCEFLFEIGCDLTLESMNWSSRKNIIIICKYKPVKFNNYILFIRNMLVILHC
jgi:hypothetical protein